jgi:hypothetical protein
MGNYKKYKEITKMIDVYIGIGILLYLVIGFVISLALVLNKEFISVVNQLNIPNPIVYSKLFWIVLLSLFWIIMLVSISIVKSKESQG